MPEGPQVVVNVLKACAEMCGILMQSLTEQGFSRKEALDLTKVYLHTITKPKSKEENENGKLEF